MKNIAEYITESKNFKLTDNERSVLTNVVGIVSADLGDPDEEKSLKGFIDKLTDKQKSQFSNLYDLLDDEYTFHSINRNMIKDDIPLIKSLLEYIDENNLFTTEYELWDILDKIS